MADSVGIGTVAGVDVSDWASPDSGELSTPPANARATSALLRADDFMVPLQSSGVTGSGSAQSTHHH